ncbi:hypothetical protein [Candidatus Ichthyocystis sparus]|uniref:hypothetical protein n=1 Tax=Candidatus Ichthyocystis sparus TaxID=1561004 RepID=UPI000B81B804|nr:hypothetical protein [Candidatus Ichthyocystis sparus]
MLILTLFIAVGIATSLVFFIRSKNSNINIFNSYITMNEQAMLASAWNPYLKSAIQENIGSFSTGDIVLKGMFQSEWTPGRLTYSYMIPADSFMGDIIFSGSPPIGSNTLPMVNSYIYNYKKSDAKIVRSCQSKWFGSCLRFTYPSGLRPGGYFRYNFYERIFDNDGNASYFINDIYSGYYGSAETINFFAEATPLLKPLFEMIYDPLNFNGYISGSVKCKHLYKYFPGSTVYNASYVNGSCGLVISPVMNGVSDPIVGKSNINSYIRRYAIFQERSPAHSIRSNVRPYIMGVLFYLPAGRLLATETMILMDVTVHNPNSNYFHPRVQVRCYSYGSNVTGCYRFSESEVSDFFKDMIKKLKDNYYT